MSKHPLIVAHRGCSKHFPENTAPAFAQALTLPVDSMEFDLRLTRDNKIVIIHDATVDRTSNGTGKVRDLTLKELKELDFGSWKEAKFAGTKIMEFTELLDLVKAKRPDLFLAVELKDSAIENYAQVIFSTLRDYNYLDNCSIISFNPQMLEAARAFDQNLQIHGFHDCPGVSEADRSAYYSSLNRIGVHVPALTPELVKDYKERYNLLVDVWAIDTRETWEHATACGVDSCTSNDPATILPWRE